MVRYSHLPKEGLDWFDKLTHVGAVVTGFNQIVTDISFSTRLRAMVQPKGCQSLPPVKSCNGRFFFSVYYFIIWVNYRTFFFFILLMIKHIYFRKGRNYIHSVYCPLTDSLFFYHWCTCLLEDDVEIHVINNVLHYTAISVLHCSGNKNDAMMCCFSLKVCKFGESRIFTMSYMYIASPSFPVNNAHQKALHTLSIKKK